MGAHTSGRGRASSTRGADRGRGRGGAARAAPLTAGAGRGIFTLQRANPSVRPLEGEGMAERVWQVLIADLKASRDIPARERPRADRALRLAIQRILRAHGAQFRLVPQVLKGDELQAVLKPDAPALTILTHLRPRLVSQARRKLQL